MPYMKIKRPESGQKMPQNAKLVHKGVLFDTYQWEQEMFDGTHQTFEQLKRPDTVVVFGILDDGSILLTKQEQPGKPMFIGAAGGRADENENILETARRELAEETGYQAKQYTLWFSEQPFSKIDWAVYVFVAKGLKKIGSQNLDSGERITLYPVSFENFLEEALKPEFSEREIVKFIYEAKIDPLKLRGLKKLLEPLDE